MNQKNNSIRPKILFVFHGSDLRNGGTRSLLDIVTGLQKKGSYNISAIFPKKEGTAIDYLQSIGIESIFSFQYGNLMQDLTQPLWKRAIKVPVMFIRLARVRCEAQKAAKIFTEHNFDIVYSNTSAIVFGGYLGLFLHTKQMWHIREFRVRDHRIKFFLGEKWLKRFINKCAQKVLFVSESVRDENTDIIPIDKCVVTYNSYDDSFIDPREIFNTDKGLRILVAGDIKPSKGQLVAVDALATMKRKYPEHNVKLYLAGAKSNAAYYNEINSHILRDGLENDVTLLGHVSDMKSLRKEMDIGIVSSDNEAFGRTTIEGMLSSMAMIGRNSGGTREQITDGITGLLYDGTKEDLAEKIENLYSDREKMKKCAHNGFKEAVELYTHGRCANIVDKAIQEVLNI